MPRLLSEYFAARAQSAGRNCPNAVGEMAMRKETATTASALIVWKTTVALVIGSGLEDNKRFTNVKGYASQVLAKTSRFRGLQRRERLFCETRGLPGICRADSARRGRRSLIARNR